MRKMGKQSGISQETLKWIACVTMLIDHIGVVLVPGMALRIIGRVAFPIFCFLLAEGVHYTRSPKRYALRLALGALLSELPYDLVIAGFPTWYFQSVMLTLLLGFFALELTKKCSAVLLKILAVVPFALLAEWMGTDYGGSGVAMIALFGLTRDLPNKNPIQTLGMAVLCCIMPGASLQLGPLIRIPVELFAVAAMIPISLYSGRKVSGSKGLQWGFYLFYPLHLTVLYFIGRIYG